MRRLDIRRGAIGGSVVALMSAAGVAGRSPDPLPTFLGVLAPCLVCAAPILGLAVLVNRNDTGKPAAHW